MIHLSCCNVTNRNVPIVVHYCLMGCIGRLEIDMCNLVPPPQYLRSLLKQSNEVLLFFSSMELEKNIMDSLNVVFTFWQKSTFLKGNSIQKLSFGICFLSQLLI